MSRLVRALGTGLTVLGFVLGSPGCAPVGESGTPTGTDLLDNLPQDPNQEAGGTAQDSTSGSASTPTTSPDARPKVAADLLRTISPARGSVDGGTLVTLQGPGVTDGSVVLFDDTPATGVQLTSPGTLTAVAPAHAAGTASITVITPQDEKQTVSNAFRYVVIVPPNAANLMVSSLAPAAGPPDGGTYVTIRGKGFDSGTAILFGDYAATSINFLNPQLLTVVTPPHPDGLVNVMVQTAAGDSLVLVNGFQFTSGLPPDNGVDTDGDGLTDFQEVAGWQIWIDRFGLGMGVDTFGNVTNATRYVVHSDPANPDTDGDGLTDFQERLIGSDPQKVDTDGDLLSDFDEWMRWKTSPTTVDTDGDCRGPNGTLTPNSLLFDGQELFFLSTLQALSQIPDPERHIKRWATSPSQADTDGDGISDFDELNSTFRSPIIADLPQIQFEIVDKLSVRLHVEYADSIGTQTTYGTDFSQSASQSFGQSDLTGTTSSWQVGAEAGFEGEGFVAKVTGSYGQEHTTSTELTQQTATDSTTAYSNSLAQSRQRSVTQSSGSVSVGLRAVNTGSIVYTLNNINITLRQFRPQDKSYQALTSLVPTPGADMFVLSPGESTPVIPLADNNIDAGLISDFLAHPSSLFLEPTSFSLLNEQGTNFAFQTQETFGRTALIVVDYGDGTVTKQRIAVDVGRNAAGNPAGMLLIRALAELGIGGVSTAVNTAGPAVGLRRFASIGPYAEQVDTTGPTPVFSKLWVLFAARGNPALGPLNLNVNQDELVVHARDEIRLIFMKDQDGDGLLDRQEFAVGSSDLKPDTDGDGLNDFFEVRTGWDVTVTSQAGVNTYHVFSNPTLADADGDGLSDAQELTIGTDPNNPDTDDDTLSDSVDPAPLQRASVYYVNPANPAGGDGNSWATAFNSLAQAMFNAPAANVHEIWVATGTNDSPGDYLTSNTAIYGGFTGTETHRIQRNPDPGTNGTRIQLIPTNKHGIIATTASNIRVDGFTIDGGADPNLQAEGLFLINSQNITLANLQFQNFSNSILSGVGYITSDGVTLDKCTFVNNLSDGDSGALAILGSGSVRFRNCAFLGNVGAAQTALIDWGGGAVKAYDTTSLEFTSCVFRSNQLKCPATASTTERHGGALDLERNVQTTITNCVFQDNQLTTDAGDQSGAYNRGGGAIAMRGAGDYSIVDCVLLHNASVGVGGGLYVGPPRTFDGTVTGYPRVRLVNCSIVGNNVGFTSGGVFADGGGAFVDGIGGSYLELFNCIVWGNTVPAGSFYSGTLGEQIDNNSRAIPVSNCCIENIGVTSGYGVTGFGNIGRDPFFANQSGGDLRLLNGSPCIDAGNSFRDTNWAPGNQPLPATDVAGNPRIVDGDGNGVADVDMGAYEYQPGH